MGTTSHIPFTGHGGRRSRQILKGIDNVSANQVLEKHRNKHEKDECLNSKKTLFTNVSGTIPDDMITKINLEPPSNPKSPSNNSHLAIECKTPTTTPQRPNSNQQHRRSGRVEDLDFNPSLMNFLSKNKNICGISDKRALVAAHYGITQHMVQSIHTQSKDQSKYHILPTTLEITGKFCK